MKIIAFDRKPDGEFVTPPAVDLIADSAVVTPPHPLFLPDFDSEWEARICPAYRIGRLGKSIAQKFAPRYIDGFTLMLRLMPTGTDRELRSRDCPRGLEGLFDSAVMLGRWMEIGEPPVPAEFEISGDEWKVRIENHFEAACRALEAVSRYATVKTGDVVCPSWIPADIKPAVGTEISAAVNGVECLNVRIR